MPSKIKDYARRLREAQRAVRAAQAAIDAEQARRERVGEPLNEDATYLALDDAYQEAVRRRDAVLRGRDAETR
jgi:hypothetical protein